MAPYKQDELPVMEAVEQKYDLSADKTLFPNKDSRHSSQGMSNQSAAWGGQENKRLLAAVPNLQHRSESYGERW